MAYDGNGRSLEFGPGFLGNTGQSRLHRRSLLSDARGCWAAPFVVLPWFCDRTCHGGSARFRHFAYFLFHNGRRRHWLGFRFHFSGPGLLSFACRSFLLGLCFGVFFCLGCCFLLGLGIRFGLILFLLLLALGRLGQLALFLLLLPRDFGLGCLQSALYAFRVVRVVVEVAQPLIKPDHAHRLVEDDRIHAVILLE